MTGGDSCTATWQKIAGTHAGCGAGKGRPAQAQQARGREVRRAESRGREVERKKVAKPAYRVPRKAAMAHVAPVPQTDTGGQGENPKAGGRSIAKELGKMAP